MARQNIDSVWGSTGSVIDPGTVKINNGWGAEIPPFETQNFWQKRADELLLDIEENGIMTWDADTVYAIGSWVMGSDREIYKSLTASNSNNDPISSPVNWKAFSDIVAVVSATESVKGIAEIATLAETQAGTDDTRIVTPKKLKDAIQQVVPDASTSTKGKVELATNTEAQTGTDTVRAVTPAALASVTATETRKGLVERATDAEVTAGIDTERYCSVKQVKDKVNALVPTATTTAQGKVELATNTEVVAGIDTTRAITPAGLNAFSKDLSATGHMVLPGGLIINWGSISWSGTSGTNGLTNAVTAIFDKPFTTAVFAVTIGNEQNEGAKSGSLTPYYANPTLTQVLLGYDIHNYGGDTSDKIITYIAIGK